MLMSANAGHTGKARAADDDATLSLHRIEISRLVTDGHDKRTRIWRQDISLRLDHLGRVLSIAMCVTQLPGINGFPLFPKYQVIIIA